MIKDIAFTAYSAKDVAALRKFYSDALGIKFTEPYAEDGVEKYAEAPVGNGWFAVMSTEWLETRPCGGIAFEVDDIAATADGLRARGVDMEELHELPTCKIRLVRGPRRQQGYASSNARITVNAALSC